MGGCRRWALWLPAARLVVALVVWLLWVFGPGRGGATAAKVRAPEVRKIEPARPSTEAQALEEQLKEEEAGNEKKR